MPDANTLPDMSAVPWDRITHFYGRAGDVPGLIRALGGDDHAAAEERLLTCLEHQDGVIQATPFAAAYIVQMLNSQCVRNPAAVSRMLDRILDAARFQGRRRPGHTPNADWNSLLAPKCLWPEFVSDENDEILAEEWDSSEEEYLGWAILTERIITSGRVRIPGQSAAVD